MKKNVTISTVVGVSAALASLAVGAQMAPIQLTNPAVDSVPGGKAAAWIADENMGVLYCELVTGTGEQAQRIACFDSNGPVSLRAYKRLPPSSNPGKELPLRFSPDERLPR